MYVGMYDPVGHCYDYLGAGIQSSEHWEESNIFEKKQVMNQETVPANNISRLSSVSLSLFPPFTGFQQNSN